MSNPFVLFAGSAGVAANTTTTFIEVRKNIENTRNAYQNLTRLPKGFRGAQNNVRCEMLGFNQHPLLKHCPLNLSLGENPINLVQQTIEKHLQSIEALVTFFENNPSNPPCVPDITIEEIIDFEDQPTDKKTETLEKIILHYPTLGKAFYEDDLKENKWLETMFQYNEIKQKGIIKGLIAQKTITPKAMDEVIQYICQTNQKDQADILKITQWIDMLILKHEKSLTAEHAEQLITAHRNQLGGKNIKLTYILFKALFNNGLTAPSISQRLAVSILQFADTTIKEYLNNKHLISQNNIHKILFIFAKLYEAFEEFEKTKRMGMFDKQNSLVQALLPIQNFNNSAHLKINTYSVMKILIDKISPYLDNLIKNIEDANLFYLLIGDEIGDEFAPNKLNLKDAFGEASDGLQPLNMLELALVKSFIFCPTGYEIKEIKGIFTDKLSVEIDAKEYQEREQNGQALWEKFQQLRKIFAEKVADE